MEQFLIEGITYWIGLNDLATEGKERKQISKVLKEIIGRYIWAESHEVFNYVNWATDNPTAQEGADCVWKTFYAAYPGWHDAPCDWIEWSLASEQIHALCATYIEK